LAFRRGKRILYLEDPERLELTELLVRLLDGRPLSEVVESRSWSPNQRIQALLLLEELGREGFLVARDEELREYAADSPTASQDGRWQGASLCIIDSGAAALELRRQIQRDGGSVELVREGDRADSPTALCITAPELRTIDTWNRRSVRHAVPFVSAFPLGDEIFLGPWVEPGGACMGCLFLRLAGISPHIPVEQALLTELTASDPVQDRPDANLASALAGGLADYLLDRLAHPSRRPLLEIVNRTTGDTSTHWLMPHPACDVCGAVDGRGSRREAATWHRWRGETDHPPSAERFHAMPAQVCDDRVGLVSASVSLSPPAGFEDLHVATARFAVSQPALVAAHRPSLVCGMAADPRTASAIAQIEGLERYCLGATFTPAVTGAYEALVDDAVDPRHLPLHSESQANQRHFPFARFDPALPLTWIWAYDLVGQRPKLVPEEVASGRLARPRLFSTTSSGVAAHWSRQGALLSAALELIERDAFMIHWLLRLSPPALHADEVAAAFPAHCREVRAAGYDLVIVDLSLDLGTPVVAALGLGRDQDKPALLLGAAAALHPLAAAEKALRELRGAVRAWWTRRLPRRPPLLVEEIRQLEDHATAYSHPEWREKASFLWSGSTSTSLERMPSLTSGDGVSPLASVVDELRGHGLDLLAIDSTTPDVAASGLHVVRALVPGLQPLGFGPFACRLGGRRPFEIAARRDLSPKESDLNVDPHCFP
jgi:ribosomal protein S12 methylthiotransferase accessory factor